MPSADLEDIIAQVQKLPPITKVACASTLGLTVLAATNPFRYSQAMVYDYAQVFQKFQLWRIYTSFLLGSPTINLFYELALLYRSLSALEEGPFLDRSSDLVWQMLFACAGIVGATRPLGTRLFLNSLTTCLCYIVASTAPSGSTASFMGFFTLPLDYLPVLMIFLSLVTGGPLKAAQAVAGALVGVVWYLLIWRAPGQQGALARHGRAPDWLRKSFGERWQPINGNGGNKKDGKPGGSLSFEVGGAAKGCCGQRAAGVL